MKMKTFIKAQPNSQHPMIKRTRFHSEEARKTFHNASKTQKQLEKNIDNIIAKDKPVQNINYQLPKQIEYHLQEKLWKFFQQNIQKAENKVDKQKVNIWGQQMDLIIAQTNKKIDHIKKYIIKLQTSISSKYKQIHELHDQILRMKLQRGSVKSVNQQLSMPKNFFGQKISLIKENIIEIKNQIEKQNGQIKRAQNQVKKIEDQRQNFLRKLLKQGYYRDNGIFWIISTMIELNLSIKNQDLPDVLDNTSKLCVMQEIQNIKIYKANEQITKKKKQQFKLPNITKNRVIRSQSQQKVADLHLKDVYELAKNYVGGRIRNKDWDTIQVSKKHVNSEKINKQKMEQKHHWRENQKKRIYFNYPEEKAREVYRLLFGTKLEKIQFF